MKADLTVLMMVDTKAYLTVEEKAVLKVVM